MELVSAAEMRRASALRRNAGIAGLITVEADDRHALAPAACIAAATTVQRGLCKRGLVSPLRIQ